MTEGMATVIFIDQDYKDDVAQILQDTLKMEESAAKAVVRDGFILSAELFNYRHQIGVFPTSKKLEDTLAASYFTDKWFHKKGGFGVKFFKKIYDETIEEAAKVVGKTKNGKPGEKSKVSIDHEDDVSALRTLLGEFVKANKNRKLDELRAAMEKEAASRLIHSLVEYDDGDDDTDMYRATVQQVAPFEIDRVYNFVMDVGPKGKFTKAVRFLKNPEKVCEGLPILQGGFIFYGKISASPLPDRDTFVYIKPTFETLPDGRKKYTIIWRLANDQEYKQCGLKPDDLSKPVAYLEAKIVLTELEDGGTNIDIQMDFDPAMGSLAYGLGYIFSGFKDPVIKKMKPKFKGAFGSLAGTMTRDTYYYGCITEKEGHTCPRIPSTSDQPEQTPPSPPPSPPQQ